MSHRQGPAQVAPRRMGLALAALCALAGSCVQRVTAEEYGAELARDPRFSASPNNAYACTTCHAERPGATTDGVIYPGAPLAGATERPTFWGGRVLDLQGAVSICYDRFMRGGPLDPTDERAVALYAYLASLARTGPAVTTAVPFTVPSMTSAITDAGDATRGAEVYRRACAGCHGATRTGMGRIHPSASIVPDATEDEHRRPDYDEMTFPLVFKEKIRHGSFFGFAGTMPPFAEEVLTDAQIADLIAYIAPVLRDPRQ